MGYYDDPENVQQYIDMAEGYDGRELVAALQNGISYGTLGKGRLFDIGRSTAWRWTKEAQRKAEERGSLPTGRRISTCLTSRRDG